MKVATVLGFGLLAIACGGGGAEVKSPQGKAPQVSELERYFPLQDGKVYAYASKGTEGTALNVLRVVRKEPGKGALRGSNSEKVFAIQKDSIARVGGGTILKAPLALGTTFTGDRGGATSVDEVDVSIEVPAGKYTGCIRTLEKPTTVFPGTTRTTFCPGVGIVRLEVQSGDGSEAMELQSYGDPVKI
jgi:hypothetical protein